MSLILKKLDQSYVANYPSQQGLLSFLLRKSPAFWALITASIVTFSFKFFPNNFIDAFGYDLPVAPAGVILNSDYKKDKEFNQKFSPRFQSVESIVYYVQKHTYNENDEKQKLEILTKIVRQRFHHAYAVYGMQDNWLAVLAGRFIWKDLVAKVIPDDILKDEVASCSQVSIVIMECCKQLGIDTRKVGLKGHYALEAKVNGKWYYIDANLKPDFNSIGGRKSLAEIIGKGEQYKLYAKTVLDSTNIALKFSEINYSEANIEPAPRAYIFHFVTKILSQWLWLILLVIAFFLYGKDRKMGYYK